MHEAEAVDATVSPGVRSLGTGMSFGFQRGLASKSRGACNGCTAVGGSTWGTLTRAAELSEGVLADPDRLNSATGTRLSGKSWVALAPFEGVIEAELPNDGCRIASGSAYDPAGGKTGLRSPGLGTLGTTGAEVPFEVGATAE
jgi:hypothetical protein